MPELFIRGVSIDWDTVDKHSYLHKINSLKSFSELLFSKNVTFFTGENGSGKSTLLKAIAVAFGFNAEGGTINYRFSTYNDVSSLSGSVTLIKGIYRTRFGFFLRAETFFNVVTVGVTQYMGKNYHEKSHGESFLDFIQDFDKPGLYIIDEPEAALSPQRQLTLLRHIYKSAQSGSQFIIATHSPIILGCPDASILSFDDGKITECQYEDTLSYQITRQFLCRKDLMLKELLDD
ncbi:MAG: AAA family ATPase [Firmicutes bacterium]|nr:AAA family ATPase [Bacillota bacterium]